MEMTDESCPKKKPNIRRRITFNVRGTTFETWSETVERFPTTLLGNHNKLWQFYCTESQQYYFNRNRSAFEAILYFYQSSGKLIRPMELTLEEFEIECVYYELPDRYINMMKENEGVFTPEPDIEPLLQPSNIREKLWFIVDRPETSTVSFCYGVLSLSVLISWCGFCCAQTIYRQEQPRYNWFYADLAFTAMFLLEYCVRLLSTPECLKFVKSLSLNMIDFVTSFPYLFLLFYPNQTNLTIIRLLRQLRLFRLIRLLKMSSSSRRIKLLKSIIASSAHDLGLLLLCLFIVVVVGGSLLYFAEMGTHGTQFTSVPESMWWAIQTVVVLGYGDIIPKSNTGKIIAAFFMIFGVLTISLPVLSVVTKLVGVYDRKTDDGTN
eukprot:Seg3632.2 transcript_id=Seg3632.2/GoldUCD/mRNA.D3Y31 product="Potassium voltage-gated channel subfamily A member 2" protein_id=Seg3632.2/GoldUCD/D3Y31